MPAPANGVAQFTVLPIAIATDKTLTALGGWPGEMPQYGLLLVLMIDSATMVGAAGRRIRDLDPATARRASCGV